MKTIALLLSTLTLATVALEWDAVLTTWRMPSSDPERLNSFFQNPLTRKDAVSAGWANARVKQSLKVDTWCLPDDPRFCMLFDKCGTLAGVQLGVLVSDFENVQSIYNMSRINVYQIKEMFDQKVWTSVAWIKNPVYLKSGGCSGTRQNLNGTKGIWFETTDGYLQIPRNLADLDSVWTEQACISTMGTHYYYDMRNTTACEGFMPWFLMFQNGSLRGMGHQLFGTSSMKNRTWNDVIPLPAGVKAAVPYGPQCLYDWPVAYGLTSLHVFFTKEAWTFTCP